MMKNGYLILRKFIFLLIGILAFNSLGAQDLGVKSVLMDHSVDFGQIQSNSYNPLSAAGCDYILDDGIPEIAIKASAGLDFMWMIGFDATGGCEQIHTVSLGWNVLSDMPCRLIIYEDPTDDGDPSDAIYLTETIVTAVPYDGNIYDFQITPTIVTGGYFVAALIDNLPDLDYPSLLDQTTTNMTSYYIGAPTGTTDVMDLLNNPPAMIDNAGFPGNWVLRAQGEPLPIPLSNSGIILGFLLMGTIIVFGRKLI